jgi:alpha-D-ribose 1-methylphosphonate 5-triphosphate synthase subunit PhnL
VTAVASVRAVDAAGAVGAIPHLSLRQVQKTFVLHILHGKTVLGLDGVSFDIQRGAFAGIAGPSGSGKSSLLKCIFRTYRADAGSMRYQTADGRVVDLVTAPDAVVLELRAGEIAYVSQFLRPVPRVRALDLAARPLYRRGVSRQDAQERVAELFARLQLPRDLWDGYPVLFSGGEQQRVNLARALAAEPRLLLLDEPTSSLNPSLQREVVTLLQQARARGTTMIGVMHDMALLRELADVVLTLDRGRLRPPD